MNGETETTMNENELDKICEQIAAALGEYRPFDQERHLGEPPWSVDQVAEWEAGHGHDVRLKCYPEFGCQVIEAEMAEIASRLLAEIDRLRAVSGRGLRENNDE